MRAEKKKFSLVAALTILSRPRLSSGATRRWIDIVPDERQPSHPAGDPYRYSEARERGWPFTSAAPTSAPTGAPTQPPKATTARPTNNLREPTSIPTAAARQQDMPYVAPTTSPTTLTPTTEHPTDQPVLLPTATPTTANGCPPGFYPYTIDMYDRWGDGWDGTELVLKEQYGYEETFRGTLETGHVGSEDLCLSNMRCYEVSVEGWSQWDAELSWEIYGYAHGTERVRVAYGAKLGSCTFDPKGGSSGSLEGCPNTCRDGDGAHQDTSTTPNPAVAPGNQPPTKRPTRRPTVPIPENRPPGYFNYDSFDRDFGPAAWGTVDTTGNLWEGPNFDNIDSSNRCIANGMQSPIVLPDEGVGTMPCQARRQIRTRSRRFSVCDGGASGTFQITPTRLRIAFASGYEPSATMPEGGNALEAAYLEVAVPSLHRRKAADGSGQARQYDAEYTIVHPWNNKGRLILISVLIDASAETRNGMFQTLLEKWSSVQTCSHPFKFGGRRKMVVTNDAENGVVNLLKEDAESRDEERRLQCDFDIYHKSLVTSIYYQSYFGSLPEPPCNGNANWRVISKPMLISADQLSQMKTLLANGPCKNSAYAQGLVGRTRPVQPSNGRAVEQCGINDFRLDCNNNCNCQEELCPSDFV